MTRNSSTAHADHQKWLATSTPPTPQRSFTSNLDDIQTSRRKPYGIDTAPDNVAPLVKLERKVPMAPDPPREGGVHDGLRSRTDRDRLLKIILPTLRKPRSYPDDRRAAINRTEWNTQHHVKPSLRQTRREYLSCFVSAFPHFDPRACNDDVKPKNAEGCSFLVPKILPKIRSAIATSFSSFTTRGRGE